MRRSNVAFGGVMDHLTKMPPQDVSSVNFSSAQTEKPQHYTYLKEFRTQQCPEFLQHKCTRHRPYTCFHWHFVNQKRRRPVKRRDGTFNYSGDIYCQKYDETSGICPDGDDCPLLHRVAGDAERRYHLRYYKTCHCVHETDSRGQCTKNGQHCAFAHGADDIRNPVFEDGEEDTDVAASGAVDKRSSSIAELSMSLEKDILCNEDPTWNDMHYVLAQYKTEVCRRPHRLCRQGYACPSYHNLRDKRRSPLKFKYRSTPCPSVKHGDEWGDPSQCDNGDECSYCHTRTEQQFHPEIYKSTKCNDMVQTGYCPRGPFCAFAHVEQEMNAQWDIPLHVETSLAAFVCNALPGQTNDSSSGGSTNRSEGGGNQLSSDVKLLQEKVQSHGIGIPVKSQSIHHPSVTNDVGHMGSSGWVDPMQGCASSVSSDSGLLAYHKAPGCERENAQLWTRRRASTMEAGVDAFAHHNRAAIMPPRHGIPPLMHSFSLGSPGSSGIGSSQLLASVPRGTTLYSSEETVESVIGNALDEDVGRLNLASLGSDLLQDDADSNDVCSPLSTSFSSITASGHFSALSSSGLSAEAAAAAGLTLQNYGQSPVTSYGLKLASLFASSEPSTEMAVGFANSLPSSSAFGAISPLGNHEVQRLKEELAVCNMKLLRWKEGIAQARNACEAWRKEAEDWSRKTKKAEEEKQLALRQRDEAIAMVARLRQELEGVHGGSMHCAGLQHANELDYLPPARLQQMHGQLQHDLDRLEKVMKKNIPAAFGHCCVCKERKVNLFPAACQHCVVCVSCATQSTSKCPICWSALLLPTSSNIVPS